MNEWLPALISAVINLLVAVFVYGRLTQTVSDHARRIADLEVDSGKQWSRLSDHGERISKLEGIVR